MGPYLPYMVNLYGSHPDEGNDDCWTGKDFATLAEAQEAAAHLDQHFDMVYFHLDTEYVEIDGPDFYQVTHRPGAKERRRQRRIDDAACQSEHAHQQGMGLGIQAYNEAMGWD